MADYTYDKDRQEKQSKPEYWWKRTGRSKSVHESVFDTIRFLDQHQSHKADDNLRRVRLYGNLPIFGLSPTAFSVADPRKSGRVRLNVVRSVIDTAVAHIAKERPRPTVVTDGASYRLKRHAKKLGQFILGVFQQNDVYKQGPAVFRDGALTGTGLFKSWIDWQTKSIKIERVFSDELRFDDAEAMSGWPRALHHVKPLAREVVLERWGNTERRAKKIREATAPKPAAGIAAHRNLADMLEVAESWHLPSGPNAKDGRHVICIENETLFDEAWDYDCFPFAAFTWGDPVYGLLGMGVTDQLTGIQVSLNKHMDALEEELGLAVSRILVPSNGDIPKSHWVNRIGQVLTYQAGATPPQVLNPDMVPPGRREQIMFLIQEAYELAGVNQLSATGKKPAGLNAGKALREYQDIQSERFAVVQQSYEDTFVQLGRLVTLFAQELYGKHKKLEVKVRNRKFLETIRFGEIDIRDHQYELQIFPTSMLPKTPAARYAQIDEWVQAGYLNREEGMRLMDMPDLEDATSLITAALDDIDATIDRLIYDEPKELDPEIDKLEGEEREQAIADLVYLPPDGMQAIPLGLKRVLAAALRARHDGTPEARKQLLVRWMDDAKLLLPPPAAALPGMPPAAPVDPGAAQMMPPMSGAPPAMPALPMAA